MYKVGFSNGGLNIISQIIYKYFHISLAKTTMVINFIVVLIGGAYFGFNMMLYAFSSRPLVNASIVKKSRVDPAPVPSSSCGRLYILRMVAGSTRARISSTKCRAHGS